MKSKIVRATLKEKLLNNRGGTFLTAIGIFAIIIMVTLFGMDIARIYTIRNDIEMEMERCAVSSIELATADNYRSEHESVLDEDIALAYFTEYIYERLRLNANNERCNTNGAAVYKIIAIEWEATESPAALTVSGEIEIGFSFLKEICPITMHVPFSVSTQQIRLDES